MRLEDDRLVNRIFAPSSVALTAVGSAPGIR
jgi:hypothetical protein